MFQLSQMYFSVDPGPVGMGHQAEHFSTNQRLYCVSVVFLCEADCVCQSTYLIMPSEDKTKPKLTNCH